MDYPKNTELLKQIDKTIENVLHISQGVNKRNEIKRLIWEILQKYQYTITDLLKIEPVDQYIKQERYDYHDLKRILLFLRYPDSGKKAQLDKYNIYLPELKGSPNEKIYQFNPPFKPDHIYIEQAVAENPLVKRVLKKYSDIEATVIDKMKNIKSSIKHDIQIMGKRDLFLVEEKYDIFKPCPCTQNVVCCNYYILNIGFGCLYDCSYCYLQHYTNFAGIILPVNIDHILQGLSGFLEKQKKSIRVGTGEFTDSLIFDDLIPYSDYLISFFHKQPHILELKTKTTNINNIIKHKGKENIVISWSLNTPYWIEKSEFYAPSLKDRLDAARQVINQGYKVGFHFDPIIYYKNWEKDYKETVEMMIEYCQDNIAWISLGVLRFHRTLKPVIEQRFPQTELLSGELFIDPVDGKMRYSEDIRIEIFTKMNKWIQKLNKNAVIYLCMEPEGVWQKVFNIRDNKYQIKKGISYLT